MNLKMLCLLVLMLIGSACGKSDRPVYQGYIEGENIYLSSLNSGILVHRLVSRGESVKKGQPLFELDPNPQALQLQQYQQDIEQAKNTLQDLQNPRRPPEIAGIEAQIAQVDADLKLAQVRADRNRRLYEKDAAAKDTLDEAVDNMERLKKLKAQYEASLELAKMGSREEQIEAQQAQVASLMAKYKEKQWDLAQKKISAPDAGIIYDTYFNEGEFVGVAQAVLSLLTPAHVHVEFFVPEQDLNALTVGQKIAVRCESCEQAGEATITYISPVAEYIPPLVYSRDNRDKLVFRIKATPLEFNRYKPGQPVLVSPR